MTQRIEDVRKRAHRILQGANVLLEGHFDFGNGYHGRTYLNPHMLFCQPSTIWQLAQDLGSRDGGAGGGRHEPAERLEPAGAGTEPVGCR